MTRLRLIRLFQDDPLGAIEIELSVLEDDMAGEADGELDAEPAASAETPDHDRNFEG
jgi:hypothetical protein